MQQMIDQIREQADSELSGAKDSKALGEFRVKFLGRKGPVQGLMKELKGVPNEERPAAGKAINDLKQYIEKRCVELEEKAEARELDEQLKEEVIDTTLPGRARFMGGKHLLHHELDQIVDILVGMGFSVQDGPHIEGEWYNFESLRITKDHPARDMQDTFYIDPETVLRTHTSNVQPRVMEANKPPIRVIVPGRAFRNEDVSSRSHVFFHQIEGFYIDEGVTFADLFGTMNTFLCKLFGKEVPTRFRPSYFPFVEPGMEVDVSCFLCDGKGCSVCKKTGWLEVAGAGMIHPGVLENCGIDSEKYSGYAWGMGLERLVMIKHGIDDIRYFTQNDMRFLRQFAGL